MNSRRNLGLVGGAATLLAAAPLSGIFASYVWLFQSMITVALIVGAATLARSMRAPVWAQAVAMALTLLFALTWLFPTEHDTLALIPTPDTFGWFGALLQQAMEDVRSYGVPVPDRKGLIFLAVLGVGSVAILVDLVTVSLRRPALAGLPMLAIYSVPVAVYTEDTSSIPFVIGATGFLWLLVADNVERVRRFGRRFTGEGRDIDAWEPSPLAAAGRRLAVVGVLIAVLVPMASPNLGLGLVNRFTGSGSGDGPGNGPNRGPAAVDLFAELNGRLNQNETYEMLKVTTNEENPYYLRFAVADQVNSSGFRSRSPRGDSVVRSLEDPRQESPEGMWYGKYRATVEIGGRFNMPMLPIYSQPISTDGLDSAWFYDKDMQVIFSGRSRSLNRKYTFDYVSARYDPSALRAAKALPVGTGQQRPYTSVPAVRAVADQVTELIADKTNDYDKVRAIHRFFSTENGFKYDLQTEPGSSGTDIVNFLTNRTGFCEQYAAAMAWMVRAANIPARVAFGFTNGSSGSDNAATLTNRNLHAWTEVYFTGFGWVPFDPTPSASVAGSRMTAWAPDPNQPPDAEPTAAPSVSVGPGGAAPLPGDDSRAERDPGGQGAPIPTPSATNWPWWTLAGVALIILVLALPALRRAALRRRRRFRPLATADAPEGTTDATDATDSVGVRPAAMTVVPDPERARSDAHAAWDELLDTMIDFRIPVDPTETPRSTTERLVDTSTLTDRAADGARLLGRAEERARYAREPMHSTGLPEGLGAVRQALAAAATRRQRLIAALLPPSVLLRWRLALVDLGTATVLTGGRWRDRVTRFSPRRRLLASRASR
jgi:transglutaminase-like putative cysteine protease